MKAKVLTTTKMSLRCKMTSTTTPCSTTWSLITTKEEEQPAIFKHPHNNNKSIKTASSQSMEIKRPFSSSNTRHTSSHNNKWLKTSHRSVERLPSLMARLSTQRRVPMAPRWSALHTPPITTWSSRVLGRPLGNTMTRATSPVCEAVIWAG